VAASFAGIVKREKGGVEEAMLRNGVNAEDVLSGTTTATTDVSNYENLESLTGGFMEYLKGSDDFKILDFNRPNINLKEFFDFVQLSCGAAFGLTKTYTTLKTDTAYTAFRGDMLLAWATFYDWQKWLERRLCDWVAVKAVDWAIRKKQLKVSLPKDWATMLSWSWPVMPQVDPEKEGNALTNSLKNGFTDYEEVLGPDAEERLVKAGRLLDVARAANLPISADETKSGQLIASLLAQSGAKSMEPKTNNESNSNNQENAV
jgi:capsid protein